MKVIGFSGLPGSGKSTAIDAIKDLGIIITMGDVIRNEAKNRGFEPTGENLGKIAKELREKWGEQIIAKKCVELIQNLKDDIVFIDGIRSMVEVDVFRKNWTFPLIATFIDDEIRFERLKKRGRTDDPKNLEDLKKRDERELDFGLMQVVNNADYKINNISTKEKLQKKTRKIVLRIISK